MGNTINSACKKIKKVKKTFSFENQHSPFLWHTAHIFRHPWRRGIYLACPHAGLIFNGCSQAETPLFVPIQAGFLTKEQVTSPEDMPQRVRASLISHFLCSKVGALRWHSGLLNSPRAFRTPCIALEFMNLKSSTLSVFGLEEIGKQKLEVT